MSTVSSIKASLIDLTSLWGTRCAHVAAVLVALFVGGLFSTESFAATVPLAYFDVFADGLPSQEISGPGTVSGSYCDTPSDPTGGCENSSASASAGLAVSAHGSSSGGLTTPGASAWGKILSYYEITGPGSVPVPLIISGSASSSAFGSTDSAWANASIWYGDTVFSTCSSTAAGGCTVPQSGSLNAVSFFEVSNTLEYVQVVAIGGGSLGSGSFSAQVSGVTLGIDPTWLASNPGYSLKLSSNIAAVPEPDTYAMMLAGLGLMGFITTRRSKAAKAA